MAFSTGFHGTVGGSVQTSYTDQPGQAYDGMLAFSSDIALCDALYVAESDGIACGRGVTSAIVSDAYSLQRPNRSVSLPTVAAAATDFWGVVTWDEYAQSDSSGVAGIDYKRIAKVLRYKRAGGRIYVLCPEAVTAGSSTVNWVTVAGTDGLYEAGQFAPAALAGTSAAGTSVSIADYATWVTSCSAGGYAIMELHPKA